MRNSRVRGNDVGEAAAHGGIPRCRPGIAAVSLCASLIGTPASAADPAPSRFMLQASMQAESAAQAGSGFEVRARLTRARTRVEGGGYAIDAVATPAGTCSGSDIIFRDGFAPRVSASPSGG